MKIRILFLMVPVLWSCIHRPARLPILGEMDISGGDTVFHQIPDFSFINQYGEEYNQDSIRGKIYVSDFFFTKCPTICPKMAQQLLRIHERFADDPDFRILSHSIDPKYDTTEALLKYAEKLGVGQTRTWHFLSLPKDQINETARQYLAAVQEDSTAAGGFTHTGHFLLVDGERHIRSFCDGTKAEEVDRLMKEISILLDERRLQ